MKKSILLYLLYFVVLSTLSFSQTQPKIIWEKQIPYDDSMHSYKSAMDRIGDEIYIWAEGEIASNKVNVPNTKLAWNMKLDMAGNFIYKNRIISETQFRRSFNNFHFFYDENGLKARGTWYWNLINRHPSQYIQFDIDENGNVSNFEADSSGKKIFRTPGTPKSMYDSVYIRYWSDLNFELKNAVLVYNSAGEYIREIELDVSSIGEEIESIDVTFFFEVYPTHDTNLIAINYSTFDRECPYDCIEKAFVCKYNLSGKLIWKATINNDFDYDRMMIYDVYESEDHSYYIFGDLTRDATIENVALVAKIDSSGNVLWNKTIKYANPRTNTYGNISNILPIRNGDYFVSYGFSLVKEDDDKSYQYYFLMIIDSLGNKCDEYNWVTDNKFCFLKSVIEKDNGNLIVMGVDSYYGIYLAEIEPDLITSVENNDKTDDNIVIISPNPASNVLKITSLELEKNYNCSFYDYSGRELFNFDMNNNYELDVSNYNAGIYFISFTPISDYPNANHTFMKKILISK